jgi:protoheme IX farnesyltransferase
MMAPVLGVFLLACGACALNQFQERHTDALMKRTQHRPLPSGKITPVHALCFALALLCTGIVVLSFAASLVISGLGLFAVIWYNGFYTYLKRKTAFAAVPGALIGAMPPAIGWMAGGGRITDSALLALCFFFFVWQVPHFWLLLLSNQDDYEKTGLPTPVRIFGGDRLVRVVFIWLTAIAASCLMIPFYGIISHTIGGLLVTAVAILFAWNGLKLLKAGNDSFRFQRAFNRINALMLIIMVILNIEGMFLS